MMLGRFLISLCLIACVIYVARSAIEQVRPNITKLNTAITTGAESASGKPLNQR